MLIKCVDKLILTGRVVVLTFRQFPVILFRITGHTVIFRDFRTWTQFLFGMNNPGCGVYLWINDREFEFDRIVRRPLVSLNELHLITVRHASLHIPAVLLEPRSVIKSR